MSTLIPILLIPALTLVVLSFALAPLGCFLTWRRLAFFGDGLSHACTFGIAVALMLKLHFLLGISLTAMSIGMILLCLKKKQDLSIDTLFSLISYTFFAGGIVALSLFKGVHINLDDILFGDFLAIQGQDLVLVSILIILAIAALYVYWPTLVLSCLSSDLATIAHKKSKQAEVIFMMVTSLVVAFGMYLIGALLLPALMILPAACARLISHTPRQMVTLSVVLSIIGCMLGIVASYILETPTSATMVLSSSFIFILLFVFKKRIAYV